MLKTAMLGALLGDAMGVPFEFKRAGEIPTLSEIGLELPAGFLRSHPTAPMHAWSDDGAQLLCGAESLLERDGELDLEHLAGKLLRWHDEGRHQAGGIVFDVGVQTRQALDRIRAGVPAAKSGGDRCGNGSLMRVLPAAFLGRDPVQAAMAQSIPTHPHPLCLASCALYVAIVRALGRDSMADVRKTSDQVIHSLRQQHPDIAPAFGQIERHLATELPTGSGYVLDSLAVTLWALERADDFLQAVRLAVSLGGDTDTNASLTGGLAAIRFGLGSVPAGWVERMPTPPESARVLRLCSAVDRAHAL